MRGRGEVYAVITAATAGNFSQGVRRCAQPPPRAGVESPLMFTRQQLFRCGLVLALAAAHCPAAAAWIIISDHIEYVAYVDDTTISREGSVARMSDLIDLKAPRLSPYGVAHLSSLAQSEFDCSMPRMRTIAFELRAGQMGDGEVVEEVTPPDGWIPVFNGTLLDTLRKFACN